MDDTGKDNVGFSLLNTDNGLAVGIDDHAEDEEAEEDQRRRQQELQSMLANAFDDIGDDEENSTMNSSYDGSVSNLQHSGRQSYDGSFLNSQPNSGINLDEQYIQAPYNSFEQLQVLYQCQVREIKRVSDQLAAVQEENEKEKGALKRKLLLLEAENQGVNMSLKQCQDLLVEKNMNIEENLKDIDYLKDLLEEAKEAKRNSDEDIQMWKTKALELEQKLTLIEKGLYIPVNERMIRNKYEQDIADLQSTLEHTKKLLEHTEKSHSRLENELKELKKEKELLHMEKDEEIHDLYTQLELSKTQCHNLSDRVGYLETEHKNLTMALNNTTKNNETNVPMYSGTIKTLQIELKRSLDDQKIKREELKVLDNNLETLKEKEREYINQINKLEETNTNIVSENQELQKTNYILNENIKGLKENIEEFKLKANDNLNDSNRAKMIEEEYDMLKKDNEELANELKNKQQKFNGSKAKYEEDIQMVETERNMLSRQNEDLQNRIDEFQKHIEKNKENIEKFNHLEQAYKIIDNENKDLLEQVEELKNQISKDKANLRRSKNFEELQKLQILEEENNDLKKQIGELQKVISELKENSDIKKQNLEKYEHLCLDLQETCAMQKAKLYECHSNISGLESKMILKEKRDELLEDLQQKALMFEEYIKTKAELKTHEKETMTDEIKPQKESITNELKTRNTQLEEVLKEKFEQISFLAIENKNLKDKVLFDRNALNELSEVWNKEIGRLNSLVKDLKKEIDNKNVTNDIQQKELTDEIERMSKLLNQLTKTLENKEELIKECRNKEMQFMKEFKNMVQEIKSEFKNKEKQISTEYDQKEYMLKNEFHSREDELKGKIQIIQKNYCDGLIDIQRKISSNLKFNEEKFLLQNKIIEAYYDMLIQQKQVKKI